MWISPIIDYTILIHGTLGYRQLDFNSQFTTHLDPVVAVVKVEMRTKGPSCCPGTKVGDAVVIVGGVKFSNQPDQLNALQK